MILLSVSLGRHWAFTYKFFLTPVVLCFFFFFFHRKEYINLSILIQRWLVCEGIEFDLFSLWSGLCGFWGMRVRGLCVF